MSGSLKEYSLRIMKMKYMGSKARIAKYIVPIIQSYIDENDIDTYIEPFCGGGNVIDKIKCKTKIGNDIHKELIAMWIELQKGWIPPEHITEEEYTKVRTNKEKYPDYYVGYVGYHATFGAKYFGGYARSFKADGITPRDQSNESYRNTMKQIPNIKDIKFTNMDYRDLIIQNAVVYCDIPYQNATKYVTESFDYDEFWDWCRKISKNNIVLISEYNAPEDFECIWSKEHLANFDSKRGNDTEKKKRVEKLFTYKGSH